MRVLAYFPLLMMALKLMTQKMANIFNEVFVNTAQKINEKIPRTKTLPLDYLSSKMLNLSLSLQ